MKRFRPLLFFSCLFLTFILFGCVAMIAPNYFEYGGNLYRQGDIKAARQYFEDLEDKEKKSQLGGAHYRGGHYWLCKIYSDIGDYAKAIKNCEDSVRLWTPLEGMWTGDAYLNQTIRDSRAGDLHKGNWVARLSTAYSATGQNERAVEVWRQYLTKDNPNDSGGFVYLSKFYNLNKQYDEGITAAKRAIELQPDHNDAYNELGVAYFGKRQFDEALNSFKKAIEIAPGNSGHRTNMGQVLLIGRNDYAGAAEAFRRASELDPKNPLNFFLLANTYGLMGIYDDALASANKTIELQTIPDKTAAPAFGLRSLIYRYRGNKEEAMKDAEKAYSLDSAHDWSRVSLGAAYLDAGQYNESIKLLSQVKDSPLATVLEATAYARQGNVKEAGKSYLSIAEEEMSPKNIPLMEDRKALLKTFKPIVMEHRDKARSFESGGKYKEALAELTEAFKMADETEAEGIQETIFSIARRNPLLSEMSEESRKYALRGEVMIKEGNFEPAAAEFKKAIQTSPYVARLYYNSALINAELKKYPEAIRDMKTYLRAAPDAPDARAAKDEIIKWEYLMEKGKK